MLTVSSPVPLSTMVYNTAIGVHSSSGVEITDTVVYRTTGSSIICGGSGNTVSGNLVMVTSTVQP